MAYFVFNTDATELIPKAEDGHRQIGESNRLSLESEDGEHSVNKQTRRQKNREEAWGESTLVNFQKPYLEFSIMVYNI